MTDLTIAAPDTGRQILSIRVLPDLKNQLSQEATVLGTTLSQHCENIISTRNKLQKDIDDLRKSNLEKDKQIERLKLEIEDKSRNVTSDPILSDERLMLLFDKVKGKTERTKDVMGKDFTITYNAPTDVLKAIIYLTKIENS